MAGDEPINFDKWNASLNLTGRTLPGGWIVGERLHRGDGSSGGAFSVSYRVTDGEGRMAFLKVADLIGVWANVDLLKAAIDSFIHERDLLAMCGEHGLTRVVTAIDSGQVDLEGFMLPQVRYIVFELADEDVRSAFSRAEEFGDVIRLDFLHQFAIGLNQLHKVGIAHRDLKPSNVLVFSTDSGERHGKIGDLGRAFHETRSAGTFDEESHVAGDRSYAPPEQLYGAESSSMNIRFAADMYQLGNVATFMFGGTTVNALLTQELAPEHHWSVFGDGYNDALPYLNDAFPDVVSRIRASLPKAVREDLAELISRLCNPDIRQRGYPRAATFGNQYALERAISTFNLLAVRAAVRVGRTR